MKLYLSELFTVSLPLDSSVSKVNIKLQTNLKTVNLLGLEALNKNVLTISPDGKPVVDNAVFNQAILVLNVDGKESVQIPLSLLKRAKAEAIAGDVSVNTITELTGQKVDWEKCYIKFGKPLDTSTFPEQDFVFLAHYSPTR